MTADECDVRWLGPAEDDDERPYCMTHRQHVYIEGDGRRRMMEARPRIADRMCRYFCIIGMTATPTVFVAAAIGAVGGRTIVGSVGVVLTVVALVAVVVAVAGAITTDWIGR